MWVGAVCLVFAFLLSVSVTPIVRACVLKLGWVDSAGRSHRKVHANDIPRLGGVAIVVSFFAAIALVGVWQPEVVAPAFSRDVDLTWVFFLGAAAIAALGMYDDVVGATPRQKLLVQVIVAVGMVLAGFTIQRLDLPFIPAIDLGWARYPVTIFWIVGVTNAVNLIDGLDGLAAGVSLIAVLSVGIVALISSQVALAIIALSLVGALVGFLIHNFHPAKIFMGDTGSMFLGFVLAAATVQVTEKVTVAASLGAPLIALALPIFDTLTSMGRRALLGRPVFSPDKGHLHHRLLRLGVSHRGVVLLLYGIAMAFSALSMAMLLYRGPLRGVALIGSAAIACSLLVKLGYFRTGSSPTEALRELLALRRRNVHLYSELSELRRRAEAETSEAVGVRAVQLLRLAGADWVSLVVPNEHLRLERGTRSLGSMMTYQLTDVLGNPRGVLEVRWGDAIDEALLHVLESVRDVLEENLSNKTPHQRARAA